MSKVIKGTENIEMKEAFEYYYTLGGDRSLREVARKFNKSLTTIHKWNKSFNWQERCEIRDAENGRRLEERNNDTIVEVKAKYHKVLKALVGKFVEDLNNGRIKIDKISDLVKIIELDMKLLGETETKGSGLMSDLLDAIHSGKQLLQEDGLYDNEDGEE